MNAMSQHHMRARNSQAVELSNVSFPGFAFDHFTFAFVLRCMRMNHHAMLLCELRYFSQQFTRATDRKPRRKATTNAAVCLAVPFFDQRDRFINRGARIFVK